MSGAFQASTAHSEQSQRGAHIADTLTQIEVCRKIPVSVRTWRRWRARGITPPVVLLPGHPRWRVADIESFISGRRWRNSEGHVAQFGSARVSGQRHIG